MQVGKDMSVDMAKRTISTRSEAERNNTRAHTCTHHGRGHGQPLRDAPLETTNELNEGEEEGG